jgi:hypothetical protein
VPASATAATAIAGVPITKMKAQLMIGDTAPKPGSGAPHIPIPTTHATATAHPPNSQRPVRVPT